MPIGQYCASSPNINLFKETVPPWSINSQNGAGRFLYFSPSCTPCRRDISEKADPGTLSQVSLIPIARSKEDIPAIHTLTIAYSQGGLTGLQAVISKDSITETETLRKYLASFGLDWESVR